MHYGCAWYPEHWTEKEWERDLSLMREANMTVVRICEFAWSRMEPTDGAFDFSWVDSAIAVAQKHGLSVVLGTPSAAPPAWMTSAHPEVLRVDPDGRRSAHGARGHYNPCSAVYLRYCARIAGAMAERYGRNPAVIGWQIDNEYWPFSWDEESKAQWHAWLKNRYGTVENLNAHWSNAYWSEEVPSFSHVPYFLNWQNPCLVKNVREFQTWVFRRYQANQIAAIRQHAQARQWITHNFHGAFQHGDNSVLAEDLSFASYDPYVGTGHLDYEDMGCRLDITRGLKPGHSFWVMETQPGSVNWSPLNNSLDPGEVRRMGWHQVGHGADAVLFWQWRSALGGQEQYHGCLISPSGRPRPIYAEAQSLGQEFATVSTILDGTTVQTPVALLWSWNDRHAIDFQRHHKDFDPVVHLRAHHRALRRGGLGVDILRPDADLSRHRLAVAPHLHHLDDALVHNLLAWIKTGGHLVLGPRSGFKDLHGALLPQVQPGDTFAAALGGHVEDYYALEGPVVLQGLCAGETIIWGEWLQADAADTETIVSYGAGHAWLQGKAAILSRRYGKGRITYLGCWPTPETMNGVMDWCLAQAEIPHPWPNLPAHVEVSTRVGNGRAIHIMSNHGSSPARVPVSRIMRDVLTGQQHEGHCELAANATLVLMDS